MTNLTPGAADRYPEGLPDRVRKTLRHELDLIGQLDYAPYFLTVHSIVRFARSQDILCQGRGSAANSAVCYVLGITSIDPGRNDLLFERFVSQERHEPPDIDVDFEHERREVVMQWIFETYGRNHAALCSVVTRYRSRGALRDVGKALGLSEDLIKTLSSQVWSYSSEGVEEKHVADLNLNLEDRRLRLALELSRQLIGAPRHLSQHPGGFVLTYDRLDDLVPIEGLTPAELLEAVETFRLQDPLVSLQSGDLGDVDSGQLTMMKLAPNFEMAMYLAQATGAAIVTDSRHRWQEIVDAILIRGEHSQEGLQAYSQTLERIRFQVPRSELDVMEFALSGEVGDYPGLASDAFGYLLNRGARGAKPNFEAQLAARVLRLHGAGQMRLVRRGVALTEGRLHVAAPARAIRDNTVNRLLLMSSSEHHLPGVPLAFYFEPEA